MFEFARERDLDDALRDAAARVLASGRYVLGAEVDAFEREFAAFCGTLDCVGVANGTDALELALRAAGVARGDRVATVANAGYYTCAALAAIGAEPVFVDVDETLTMSPASLESALPRVKAIVVTHLYGRLAAIESIVTIAQRRAIPVIEDCAQAHGAARRGKTRRLLRPGRMLQLLSDQESGGARRWRCDRHVGRRSCVARAVAAPIRLVVQVPRRTPRRAQQPARRTAGRIPARQIAATGRVEQRSRGHRATLLRRLARPRLALAGIQR